MPNHIARLAIFIGLVIGPGSIVLSSHDRWDGAHFIWLVNSHRLDGLVVNLLDAGLVLLWAVIQLMARVSYALDWDFWWMAKSLMAIFLVWVAWEVWLFARGPLRLKDTDAMWCAALTLVFPGGALYHSSAHLTFAMCLPLALCAYRLTLSAGRWTRMWGYLLAFIALQVNSLSALLPVFELARWVAAGRIDRAGVRRLAILGALSVAAFFISRQLVGNSGMFAEAGYNKILWPTDLATLKRLILTTAGWSTWLVLVAAVPLSWAIMQFVKIPRIHGDAPRFLSDPADPGLPKRRLQAALLLCGAAILPYIAVGKFAFFFSPIVANPGASETMTFAHEFLAGPVFSGLNHTNVRHSVLLGAMLSLLTVSLGRWMAETRPGGNDPSIVIVAMLTAAWLHQTSWAAWAHREQLVQGALDVSLVAGLRSMPAPPDGSVVVMERRQRMKTPYSETNLMLYEAYGRAAWMGLSVFDRNGPTRRLQQKKLDNARAAFVRWRGISDQRVLFIAGDYVETGCVVDMAADVPEPGWLDLLWRAPFTPSQLRPATVWHLSSSC